MKSKMFLIMALAAILSMVLSSAGFARTFSPDTPVPERPVDLLEDRSESPVEATPVGHPFIERPGQVAAALMEPQAPQVTLGKPGLSYRYTGTVGISEEGYQTDGYHLNAPSGLFVDGSDNVYVIEDHGYRLLRYGPDGVNTLELGTASLCVDRLDPIGFCTPRDVATDAGGNIWVATGHRIVKFNADGDYQTQLPVPNPGWSSGSDETHFRTTYGVAIDNTNQRLFVTDRNNHRVQVYDISSGSPVYSATIGETGVPGDDNSHFDTPGMLAVDISGRVYVVDSNNGRVQRCTLNGTWGCATFVGSIFPRGVFVDSTGWVYLNDLNIGGVKKCSQAAVCSDVVTDVSNARDVAVDSSGNIYLGAYGHGVVQRYDSAGNYSDDFVGDWHLSYFNSTSRIFSPWGVAVDAAGNLYGVERYGYRFYKFNSAGVQQWVIGDPGGWGDQDDQFNNPEGKPAIASNGNIYVPDSGNARIKIYTPNGALVSTFGSYGQGNNQFYWPSGIAISPVNGDIYVTDVENHRIQVYTIGLVYKATLGVTGVSGSDSSHFNYPYDVAIDTSGKIYVVDSENYRVQKCTLSGTSYSCTTFAGETGVIGDDYGHLGPVGVAVDNLGKVFVVDDWNGRVQVFDANGAYLTTIGGGGGANTGEFRWPTGVAVDVRGNVYVTDLRNNRVQKFSPGAAPWLQVNINGFGDIYNGNIHTLTPFNGHLYAGTYNDDSGAQMWRMAADGAWTSQIAPGFGNANNIGLNHLAEFDGHLYAGVRNDVEGASIIRSSDGADWTEVVASGGFDSLENIGIYRMQAFSGALYAGTASWDAGAEIWRSTSGDSGTWEAVVTGGFDDEDNYIMRSSAVHNGVLYFGTQNIDTETFATTVGGIVLRSQTGNDGDWTKVSLNGFGDANNFVVSGLASFGGYLYAGTARWDWSGVQVWRCQECDSTDDWDKVVDNGFGNPNNWGVSTLQVFDGQLYLVVGNEYDGMEVWRSSTGDSGDWTRVMGGGFGDSNNDYPYYNNVAVFNDHLFLGTENNAGGVQVWRYLDDLLFLPLVMR
jgi:hypothetical protein